MELGTVGAQGAEVALEQVELFERRESSVVPAVQLTVLPVCDDLISFVKRLEDLVVISLEFVVVEDGILLTDSCPKPLGPFDQIILS